MKCPHDGTELKIETHHGIEVDHCPTCHGRWLDHHELDKLESTVVSTEEERRATIEFGERPSELKCPVCDKPMRVFQYRAHSLEIDTCPEEHGYWLDAGEDGRVRDIIAERVRELGRAARAEDAWGGFLGGIKRTLGGRR